MTSNFDAAWDTWARDHPRCSGFRYDPGPGTVECCDHPGDVIPVEAPAGGGRYADRPAPAGQDAGAA